MCSVNKYLEYDSETPRGKNRQCLIMKYDLKKQLKEEKLEIPVIICSGRNYTEPRMLGAVWYNELSDLNREFREVLKKL